MLFLKLNLGCDEGGHYPKHTRARVFVGPFKNHDDSQVYIRQLENFLGDHRNGSPYLWGYEEVDLIDPEIAPHELLSRVDFREP